MAETMRERDFDFTMTRSEQDDGDGLTFEGYAAVFNSPTRISDREGEYDEVIAPGAFKQTINGGNPVLMFNHGRHPLLGNMPLGRITELREDARGLFVRARLTDNWLVAPVRDAIADGAITGMSFRFEAVKESWSGRPSALCRRGELRTVKETRVPELGPVVMPAYVDTTAAVRSAFRELDQLEGLNVNIEVRDAAEQISTQAPTVLDLVRAAIKERWGLDGPDDVQPADHFEDANQLVFSVVGTKASDYSDLWRADYTYTDGAVALSGDPQPVQPANPYVPRSLADEAGEMTEVAADAPTGTETGTSDEAAEVSTSTEAAVRTARQPRAPMTTPADRETFLREVELRRRGIKVGVN